MPKKYVWILVEYICDNQDWGITGTGGPEGGGISAGGALWSFPCGWRQWHQHGSTQLLLRCRTETGIPAMRHQMLVFAGRSCSHALNITIGHAPFINRGCSLLRTSIDREFSSLLAYLRYYIPILSPYLPGYVPPWKFRHHFSFVVRIWMFFWATQKPWIEVAIAPCDRPSCQTNAWPGSQAGTDILMGLPFGNLAGCYWKWMKIAPFAVDLLMNMCFISNYLAWCCHPKSAWTSNNWEQGRWIFSCKNEYHLFMNGLWFVVAWCYLVYKDTSDFIAPFWETSTVLVTDIEES